MIALKMVNHSFAYELTDILKLFYGKADIAIFDEAASSDTKSLVSQYEQALISTLLIEDDILNFRTELYSDGQLTKFIELKAGIEKIDDKKYLKRLAKTSMYKLLSEKFNIEYPWGILTGIRPLKIVHDLMDKGYSEGEISKHIVSEYLISKDRAELALGIANIERQYVYPVDAQKVSIYIGIPFCPSRCHYCSFTSNTIQACKNYIQQYMDSLIKEIEAAALFLKEHSLIAEAVYIGGGTPTAISDNQLRTLIECVNRCFGNQFIEFTCEAGRPDTRTREKLKVMKDGLVTRLSINPQTMNDDTLNNIGRAHNSRQVEESFTLAREAGFNNINMDIILGLPGEGLDHLQRTLEGIGRLNPESVTVHTMAIKRASIYHENLEQLRLADDSEIMDMMSITKDFLKNLGMRPYYLYRQKHMLQNLENIGYSKKTYECIYNMQTIADKQSIIAFGADAVTKIVFKEENRIERQHNIKDIKLYIEQVDKMIADKLDMLKACFGG